MRAISHLEKGLAPGSNPCLPASLGETYTGLYSCRTHVPRVTASLAHEHAERVLSLKPFA
jgi:hypothetical protein